MRLTKIVDNMIPLLLLSRMAVSQYLSNKHDGHTCQECDAIKLCTLHQFLQKENMKTSLFPSLSTKMCLALVVASFGGAAYAQAPAAPAANPAPTGMAPIVKAEPAVVPAAPAPVAAPASAAKTSGDHQLAGKAAYYSNRFNGRKTASGQRFNNAAMTTAHNTLPFGTRVKVTNTKNNKSVVVRVNDRGPSTPGRVFDLTRAAAKKLGYVRAGLADVKAEVVAQPAMKSAKKKAKAMVKG
jgi:rare lipoprotein A